MQPIKRINHKLLKEEIFDQSGKIKPSLMPQGYSNHPYLSLERKGKYLYRVTFDALPEENKSNAPAIGACSAYVNKGKLRRTFDYRYDRAAEFIVITNDFEGMAMITGLNDGQMNDDLIAQLPYRMVDGRNNDGIMVSVHLLFNDWQYTGAGNKSIPLTRLPFEVLSRVKSMATISDDLVDVLGNLVVTEAMGNYLLQCLITDGTTTYALIPPTTEGESYVLVNATSNPKMSNFRYVARAEVSRSDMDLQDRPTGIERFNMMPCALGDLRFTKAYETADRLSEFIGIDGTDKDSTDEELTEIYNLARAEYLQRQRDGKTWQTVHAVVYGSRMEELYIQEDFAANIMAGDGGVEIVKLRAVDAATTPLGVSWKQGQTTITGTLAASAETKDFVVFVPSSSKSKDLYDEYVVMFDGNTYSWEKLGRNIEIPEIVDNLNSDYADKVLSARQGKVLDDKKANKDGYYQGLSAGYADKAGDLDIQSSAKVRHTQVKAMETTGGDKDVRDGQGFIRIIRGTVDGITAAGAKIISLGFNLIPTGSGTTFTFRCVKGEWGVYGTSAKNNGYLFTDSQDNILVPSSVKQNGVDVPTHTDHGNTYYLPSQDGQCTVVFASSQTNPCGHLCWSNGRDTKDNYEPYNASIVDLAPAINAIGGTLRRVGYVFDEINLETKQSIRRIGYRLLNALSWTMEAGPTPEEGEATNTFRAIVSGGVATADTIKAGGAFAIKGLSGLTFNLDGTSLVCDSTIASVADFVTALGSGTVEYELAVEVAASNSLNGQITISDYGIIIFENTAGASVVDIDFDFDMKWKDFIKNLPDDLEQMNDAAESMRQDIEAIVSNRDNLGDVHAKSIDLDELPKICHYEAIIKATTAPNVAPDFIGQMWIDTSAGKVYVATATTNASSFKVLN